MGVHDLLPFLRKNAPNAFKTFAQWFTEQNKQTVRVAVDVPIFMYKFCYGVGTGAPLCNRMIQFASDLKLKNIEPVFVFDGDEQLDAKDNERHKRKVNSMRSLELKILKLQSALFVNCDGEEELFEVDRTVVLSGRPIKEDFAALKIALDGLGIEYKVAKYEAEALCSKLCNDGFVDGILTEDSDSIAYLCQSIILNWENEIKETVINSKLAYEELGLTAEQFQDLCVLFGNDFNDRIKNIGPTKSYALLKKHQNLENIFKLFPSMDTSCMLKSKEIFTCNCYEN
jgi:flap endonuclease-1